MFSLGQVCACFIDNPNPVDIMCPLTVAWNDDTLVSCRCSHVIVISGLVWR